MRRRLPLNKLKIQRQENQSSVHRERHHASREDTNGEVHIAKKRQVEQWFSCPYLRNRKQTQADQRSQSKRRDPDGFCAGPIQKQKCRGRPHSKQQSTEII